MTDPDYSDVDRAIDAWTRQFSRNKVSDGARRELRAVVHGLLDAERAQTNKWRRAAEEYVAKYAAELRGKPVAARDVAEAENTRLTHNAVVMHSKED